MSSLLPCIRFHPIAEILFYSFESHGNQSDFKPESFNISAKSSIVNFITRRTTKSLKSIILRDLYDRFS